MKTLILSVGLTLAAMTALAATGGKASADKPWRLYVLLDIQEMNATGDNKNTFRTPEVSEDDGSWETLSWQHYDHFWLDGFGGAGSEYNESEYDYLDEAWLNPSPILYTNVEGASYSRTWYKTGWGEEIRMIYGNDYPNDVVHTYYFTNNSTIWGRIRNEHCNVSDPFNASWYSDGATNETGNTLWGSEHDTYTRTADTFYYLQTGGRAMPIRQSLWQLSGSATEIVSKRGPSANDKPIPSGQIDMGGLGKLKTDGNLWLTLPDDVDIPVTPTVAGMDYYTFTIGAEKYHPYIGLTTSTTNANLDTDTPEVCVGQTVTLGADWQGGIPPCTNIDNVWWHLSGKYVNKATNYSTTCTTYVKDATLLTNTSVQCWYVNQPGGACSVRETLHFSNGQSVNIAAAGSFTVYRPQKINENMSQDLLNFNLNIPTPLLYPTNVNGWLQLGDAQGGYARFWAEYKSSYLGEFREAQIVQSYRKAGNDAPVDSGSQWWGDGQHNKGGLASTVSSVGGIAYAIQTDQYPGLPLKAPQTVVNDVFKTYFQFKPTGDGIWVTMGRVNWSWAATSAYSGGQWNPPSGTTVSDPQYHDDDSFPLWDGNPP